MGIALCAGDFGADHTVADIAMFFDGTAGKWGIETWPAAAGMEFIVAFKQRGTTTGAGVGAARLLIGVFSRKRALGALLAGDAVEIIRQRFRPFFVRFQYLVYNLGPPATSVTKLQQLAFLRGLPGLAATECLHLKRRFARYSPDASPLQERT